MRVKSVETLIPGDILAEAVYGHNKVLLLNAGNALTKQVIKSMKQLGIPSVLIADDASEGIVINETISTELKQKVLNDLKSLNIDKALEDAKEIVTVLQDHPGYCEYFNVRNVGNYTYEHSMSVAVYATLVGIALKYKRKELDNLAISGLFHDLGKQCIPKEILYKPGKLTSEEFYMMQQHPLMGYNMVKNNYDISSTVKATILQHHENEDGSGYPRKLKSKDIYKFAKIVHIADVYDAMVSKRPYKDPMSPQKVLKYIRENAGTMFDPEYIEIFEKVVPAYPTGTAVKLSNGMEGIVCRNYVLDVLRPDVRLNDGTVISLKHDEKYKDVTVF